MSLLLAAFGVQLLGGLGALALGRSRRWATRLGVGGVLLGDVAALPSVVAALHGTSPGALRLSWAVPFGSFAVDVDALSALFLLLVLVLSAAAAVYGGQYLLGAHDEGQAPGVSWFFFALLVVSMELVLVARNAVLFLVAWEVMALASFVLVTAHDGDPEVREAGRTYLVATHLGTACLIVMFLLLGQANEPLDFDRVMAGDHAGALFLLALVGFGSKAGLVPFHVWLPDAHPAAPSHVSAVMSAVMIKTGIYGLLRMVTLLGPLPAWCGWLLVVIGAGSGMLGIVWALAQRDVKRLLAYSSIENVGIITLAMGLGLIGLHAGAAGVAVLGFAAAVFHVASHAVMKGALFLGAGTVAQQAGTRRLDRLGGLLRRVPRTGAAYLAACAAIVGLPPLAGFAGEFLAYLAAYRATAGLPGADVPPAALAIAGLALIGGLAMACFTKLFGTAFLGEPRSEPARCATEPGRAMQGATLALASGSVLLGVLSPLVLPRLAPLVALLTALPRATVLAELAEAAALLGRVVAISVTAMAGAAALALLRRGLLARRIVTRAPTWDCGYAAPTARMQYTGSSFSEPLARVFGRALPTAARRALPAEFFPGGASLDTTVLDPGREWLYRPLFRGVARALSRLRWLQHGQVQLYVLYIAITLVVLLWMVGPR